MSNDKNGVRRTFDEGFEIRKGLSKHDNSSLDSMRHPSNKTITSSTVNIPSNPNKQSK